MIVAAAIAVVVIGAIYLGIGLATAKSKGYLAELNSLEKLVNAAGMVLFWPVVRILGVEVHLK